MITINVEKQLQNKMNDKDLMMSINLRRLGDFYEHEKMFKGLSIDFASLEIGQIC